MYRCWPRPPCYADEDICQHTHVRPHSLLLAAVMLASKHCSADAGAPGDRAWSYAAYTKASGLAEGELKVRVPATLIWVCVWYVGMGSIHDWIPPIRRLA